MAILLIEGDPRTIEHLLEELLKRNYLGDDEYRYATVEAPDFINSDTWFELLCDFSRSCHLTNLKGASQWTPMSLMG